MGDRLILTKPLGGAFAEDVPAAVIGEVVEDVDRESIVVQG